MFKKRIPISFLMIFPLLAAVMLASSLYSPIAEAAPAVSLVKMYWTDIGTDKIQRADLDGSNVEDLITTTLSSPYGISLDVNGNKMYWADPGTDKIQRADLDGSNVEDLITTTLSAPIGTALDVNGNKIYWADFGNKNIRRADLDGSNMEDLITTGLTNPRGIALDITNGKMYWTDATAGKIQRANLDGSNVQDLITIIGSSFLADIALDVNNGKMYWTDTNTDKIQRANLDGSNVEDLITAGLGRVLGITLDTNAGKIYWTDADTDKIQRANLDGSNVEDLITTGLDFPGNIALLFSTAPEIDVYGNGQLIASGSTTPASTDNTDFGSTAVSGGSVAHTFTISNTGDADLTLSSGATLATDTHFSVTAQPSSPVISATTTSFEVTFDPTAGGTFTDTVSIANNDADENPYTFVISGTGTVQASPTVTTNAATAVSTSGATLNGTVNANGDSTDVTFEYGTTTSYGTTVTATESPVTGSSDTAVSKAISGLTADTTYHYRVVGQNSGGTTNGADMTFTTSSAPADTADLAISQSITNDFLDTIFTIVAQNDGPDAAPGAVISVTFPTEITNITWTCVATGGATCAASGSGNTIYDTLSSFPNGGVVTYTVNTRVVDSKVYTNAAEVIPPAGVTDPDLSNNTSEQTTAYLIILPLIFNNLNP